MAAERLCGERDKARTRVRELENLIRHIEINEPGGIAIVARAGSETESPK